MLSPKLTGRYNLFTLIELIVAMAVLTIITAVCLMLFSSLQKTWNISASRQEVYENARIALELMSRELESSYYGSGSAPFWHWKPVKSGEDPSNPKAIPEKPAGWGDYRNELIAFVSRSPIPPNNECTSDIYEIKYQLYYSINHSDDKFGWLRRSITGNKVSDGSDDSKYNWRNNMDVSFSNSDSSFTANSNSSQSYQKLIPYVLDVTFTCYDLSENIIPPDQTTSTENSYLVDQQTPYYPAEVLISITLLDKASWNKWLSLCGGNVYHAPEYLGEPASAKTFRENKQLTFTRSVSIGNRGQEL